MNRVLFTGDAESIEQVRDMFREIEEKQSHQQEWHLPDFVQTNDGFMLDIELGNQKVYYRSKQRPNHEVLQQIADHFQVGFIDRFDDDDSFYQGILVYQDGTLENIHFEFEDFEAFPEIKTDRERLSGDMEEDVIELILEEKLKIYLLQITRNNADPGYDER